MRIYAKRNLLRFNSVFTVGHREHRDVVSGRQSSVPAHLHGIFLSRQEPFFQALGLGHKFLLRIEHCQTRYRK